MFTFFYWLVALFLWLLSTPFLLYKSREKKYSDSIPARFFLKNNPPFKKELIHFHACSLGEVKALKPIIDKLNQEVSITTTTNTGMQEAKKLSTQSRFLPYEIFLPFWYKKQKLLIVLEAELWYMLFWIAKNKDMKTILLNARISDKSYNSYKKFRWFYKKIFAKIDYVFAQTNKDKERLKELGAKNIKVIGNIKVYQDIKKTKEYKKPKKEVLTIASSHEGEEELLLDSIKNLDKYKVIVVPRNPERFDKVDKILKNIASKKGLSYTRFSKNNSFESDIILIDKMGELINIYAITDIVLLGGSFVDGVGGHNPLEPAFFGCKVISGKYYFNQKALYEVVENIVICNDLSDLNKCIVISKPTKYDKNIDFQPIMKILEEKE